MIQKIMTWIKALLKKREKYHCYRCNKIKSKNKFGKCNKEHIKRVRGTDINFACKKCANIFNKSLIKSSKV